MADAERILASARIVQAAQSQTQVTVVVSAMAGVTDALLRVAAQALAIPTSATPTQRRTKPNADAPADEWRAELARLEARHRETFLAIGLWVPDIFALRWQALVADAVALSASGLDANSSAGHAAQARFSGWGERLAVDLMAHALTVCGVLAQAFADEPVFLEGLRHGDHHAHDDTANQPLTLPTALLDKMASAADSVAQPSILATRATLTPRLAMLLMRNGVPVLPGYIARDSAGRVTTLGRNGSDHSAAVIAAALGAAALYLFSDVPGLYTADPRVVPDADLLPALTYSEAGEIATLGARALHPRTVEPTARWGIPLVLRSSLAPDAPGTDIIPDAPDAASILNSNDRDLIGQQRAALDRPERWVVAARRWAGRWPVITDDEWQAETSDTIDLVEVSATRLPPWPLIADDDGCEACVAAALHALAGEPTIQPLTVWSTARQLHVVVAAAVSPQTQRLLHTALADAAASHPRDDDELATANVYEFGERVG